MAGDQRFFVLLIFSSTLLLTSCDFNNSNESVNNTMSTFEETKWVLKSIEMPGGEIVLRPEKKWEYWIRFRKDRIAEGQNACNGCGGPYEISAQEQVKIDFACTEAACGPVPPYLGFADAIAGAIRYELHGDQLRIHTMDQDNLEQILVLHAK